MCGNSANFQNLGRAEVEKKRPKTVRPDPNWHHLQQHLRLFWVDKEGDHFPIANDQDLEIGTKEMLRTASTLLIIARP